MEPKRNFQLKIDSICRICLVESNELISLYNEVNLLEENPSLCIYNVLENITMKQVPKDIKYPQMICKDCLQQAMVVLKFKRRIEKSEETFKNYVAELEKSAFYCRVCEKKCYIIDEKEEQDVCSSCKEQQLLQQQDDADEVENDDDDMDEEDDIVENNVNFDEVHMCAVCDQKFANLNELKAHIVVHTKQNLPTCQQDENVMVKKKLTKRKVVRYPYTLNADKEKVYTCSVCAQEFNRSFALSTHMRMHGTEPLHLCYLCGKRFYTSGSLTRHMATHTDQRPYACKLCPKKYKQLIGLKSHMRGHTGERPYLCSVCGKGFKQNSELKCHMRYHTQEKPHQCTVCGKRTALQSHMKQHMRTHTGEKPYSCRICAKRFGDSASVKQHEIAHSGLKPYICNICNKAFGRPNSLRMHSKLHNKHKINTV